MPVTCVILGYPLRVLSLSYNPAVIGSFVAPFKEWLGYGRSRPAVFQPSPVVPVVEAPASRAAQQNGHRRLTEADIRVIRRRLATGEKGAALAREYGIGAQTLSDIKRRVTWSHVIDEDPEAV